MGLMISCFWLIKVITTIALIVLSVLAYRIEKLWLSLIAVLTINIIVVLLF
jgi:hypothetical protein